jgi:hypothetical protein
VIKTLALIAYLTLVSVATAPQAAAAAKGGYRIVDLGTVASFPWSTAYAVNDPGQIVGASIDPTSNVSRATLWTPSGTSWTARDIGTLTGMPSSFATDISGTGLVVAIADTPTGMTTRRAFVSSGGDPVQLTTEPSEAWGVNFSGTEVAGFTRTETAHHAVVWSLANGTWSMTALPELPGTAVSEAMGVSDTGVAVGNSSSPTREVRPLVWTRDAASQWRVAQLPSLVGAAVTLARQIDRRTGTQITGESGSLLQRHGVRWTRTGPGGAWAIRDLGAITRDCCSYGVDVNSTGEVTGNSEAAGAAGHSDSSTSTVFIWTPASGMRALPSFGNRSWGSGINASGLIVGSSSVARDPMAAIHAVAWIK